MSKISDRILYSEALNQRKQSDLGFHSIMRNLQHILNIRSSLGIKQFLDEDAILDDRTFGLPDFSSLPIRSQDGKKVLCELIKKAIVYFEPRLRNVSLELGEYNSIKRQITIKVSAYFNRDNIAVNCLLNLNTMEFHINERERE